MAPVASDDQQPPGPRIGCPLETPSQGLGRLQRLGRSSTSLQRITLAIETPAHRYLVSKVAAPADRTFHKWANRWMEHARCSVAEMDTRIELIVGLWREQIPDAGEWKRKPVARLLDPQQRYCRGNRGKAGIRTGEHAIEYSLLDPDPSYAHTFCLGARLVDGVNAVPLVKDAGGRRRGNVEADMLLLVEGEQGHRLLLVEVKAKSNNAWFAVVENLRQMKLFAESEETKRLFQKRCPKLDLPDSLPVTGVVLAPEGFFSAAGAKADSLAPTRRLLGRMQAEVDGDVQLATWAGLIKQFV